MKVIYQGFYYRICANNKVLFYTTVNWNSRMNGRARPSEPQHGETCWLRKEPIEAKFALAEPLLRRPWR